MAKAKMYLNHLLFAVHLGVDAKEREKPQPVRIDLCIHYEKLPKGCYSDNHQEVQCYDQLAQLLKNAVEQQDFCLLEHLTHHCFQMLTDNIDDPFSIRVTKLQPPIDYLQEGATFVMQSADFVL